MGNCRSTEEEEVPKQPNRLVEPRSQSALEAVELETKRREAEEAAAVAASEAAAEEEAAKFRKGDEVAFVQRREEEAAAAAAAEEVRKSQRQAQRRQAEAAQKARDKSRLTQPQPHADPIFQQPPPPMAPVESKPDIPSVDCAGGCGFAGSQTIEGPYPYTRCS